MEIGGYENLVEVGRGASAVVYRARQVAFDRTVALKVLGTSELEGDARRRFERECRAIGNLGWHPHVVPVYDAGVTPTGHPFLVMEYLPTGSCAARLRREGPFSEQEAIAITAQVADALAAAHGAGVLHRDVKPGNILIGHFGDARLADFGIAALTSANTSVTDALAGTLSFMAPELLSGERATEACDVYSLGSSLFALLTNRAAYSSATDQSPFAAMMRVANDPVPDLRDDGISSPLANVVERAMAKDPATRIPTAAKLVTALQATAAELGLPAQPTYADRAPERTPATSAVVPPPPPSPEPATDLNETTIRRPAAPIAPTATPDARPVDPAATTEADAASSPSAPVEDDDARSDPDLTVRRPTPVTPAALAPGAKARADQTVEPPTSTTADPDPDAGEDDPPGRVLRRRRLVLVGALVLAAVIAAGIALVVTGGGGSTGEDVASAGVERTSTTQATTTTTEAVTKVTVRRTTTTVPPQASQEDIKRANPAGTFGGILKNSSCTGNFTNRDEACQDGQPPNPMKISCPPTGCTVSMWRFEGESVVWIDMPLRFNGESHVGELRDLDRGWSCESGDTPIQTTLRVELRTTTASWQNGAWQSEGIAGTFTQNNQVNAKCGGSKLTWDFIFERQ